MRYLVIVTLLICSKCCFAQPKDKLIRSILQANHMYVNLDNGSHNYRELSKVLAQEELLKFTTEYNSVLRLYSKFALLNSGKGNIIEFLKDEIERNANVIVFGACNGEQQNTAGVLYQKYFDDKLEDFRSKNDKIKLDKAVKLISISDDFQKMDSIIIFSDTEVSGQIWNQIITRKNLKKYKLRIERLAFQNNNFYAFSKLIKKHPKKYLKQTENFFSKKFPTIDFDSYHGTTHLIHYLDFLLNSKNKEFQRIATERVKKQEWKNHEFQSLIVDHIKEKGINLDNNQ